MPTGAPMPTGPKAARGAARTSGLWLAGVVAVVIVLGLAGFALFNRPPSTPADPGVIEPPPDVKQLPASAGGSPLTAGGSELLITLIDPANPARVQYEITAAKSEPLPGGRYRMTRPRAWYFLPDGRSMLLQADRGQASIPSAQESSRPESGLLEGNVLVRMFPRLEGARRPLPDSDTPSMTLRTNLLRFDGVRSELELPERFDIDHDAFTLSGIGLTAYFNEAAQRLESATLQHQLAPLVLRPARRDASAPSRPPAPARPATAVPAPPTTKPTRDPAGQPAAPVWYAATLTGPIEIHRGELTLQGEHAEGWAAMIGGALAPGLADQPRAAPAAPSTATSATPSPAATSTTAAAPPRASIEPDVPTSITWQGVATVSASEACPQPASREDAFVRLTGTGGKVNVLDASRNARARGDRLDYAATSRTVQLVGTTDQPAEAELIGSGKAIAPTLTADLRAGRARMFGGPSALIASGVGTRGIWWTNEGEFTFATKPNGEFSTLQSAKLSGDALARDNDATLRASAIDASFHARPDNRPVIATLSAIGSVHASDGKGGAISGDAVGVTFRPDDATPADPAPELVTITGHAHASRGEDAIDAGHLVASLGTDAKGARTVIALNAGEGVVFQGANGVRATAPNLTADPIAQTAHLTGAGATISNAEGRLTATDIALDAVRRSLEVTGAGDLARTLPAEGDQPAGTALASWQRGMTYDDLAGTAVCDGDAAATLTRGDVQKDSLWASNIRLNFTPKPPEAQPPTTPTPPADANARRLPSRQLDHVVAQGSETTPAHVELRRYAAGSPGVLERLLYLEGATISADNTAGTLDVPGSGKALALDRRSAPAGPTTPGLLATPSTSRGTSLFRWQGSLHVDRAQGKLEMARGVTLVNQRESDGQRTELEGDVLTAWFGEPAEAHSPDEFQGRLTKASATGAVWLRSAGKELQAAAVEYDAARESAEAWAAPGSLVTLADPARPSPLSAGRLTWDLKTGRIEVLEARPITTPR